MTAIVACMATGAVCAIAGPWLLRGMGWQVAHPARALRLWFTLFVGGLLAFLGSVACAIHHAVTVTGRSGGVTATSAVLSGWLMLGLLGVAIGLIGHHAGHVMDGRRAAGKSLLVMAAHGEGHTVTISGARVAMIDAPTAFAVTGRDCDVDVLVSRPLVLGMSGRELRAVVQHEIGHLRGRHGLLRTVSLIADATAPRARCGKDFARTVHLLTELAADDRAAARCGSDVTAAALRRLADLTGDAGAALRAQRVIGRMRDRQTVSRCVRPATR